MKSTGMPFAMWQLFEKSFKQNLTAVFGMTEADAKSTMAKAKKKYKETIGNLPEFEKGDRFRLNIVGCAMLAAAVLSMPERPEVETLTVYYRKSMMTAPMKWFCRMSGKKKFTPKDMDGMKQTAALRWLPSETRLRVNRNDIKTGAHLILAKEKGQGNSLDLV